MLGPASLRVEQAAARAARAGHARAKVALGQFDESANARRRVKSNSRGEKGSSVVVQLQRRWRSARDSLISSRGEIVLPQVHVENPQALAVARRARAR